MTKCQGGADPEPFLQLYEDASGRRARAGQPRRKDEIARSRGLRAALRWHLITVLEYRWRNVPGVALEAVVGAL